jgi:hypothetical protein
MVDSQKMVTRARGEDLTLLPLPLLYVFLFDEKSMV